MATALVVIALGVGFFLGRITAPEVVTTKMVPVEAVREAPRIAERAPPERRPEPQPEIEKSLAAVAEVRRGLIAAIDTWHDKCWKTIHESPPAAAGMLNATKTACGDMAEIMNAALERAMSSARAVDDKAAIAALADLSHEMDAHYQGKCRSLRNELIARGFAH